MPAPAVAGDDGGATTVPAPSGPGWTTVDGGRQPGLVGGGGDEPAAQDDDAQDEDGDEEATHGADLLSMVAGSM